MPNGHYVEIPDAAHQIWLTHPDKFHNELRKAIRRISATTSRPALAGRSLLGTKKPVPLPRSPDFHFYLRNALGNVSKTITSYNPRSVIPADVTKWTI